MTEKALTLAQAWRELLMDSAAEGTDPQPIYDQLVDSSTSYFSNAVELVQLLARHGYIVRREDWNALFPSDWGTDQVIFAFTDKSCLLIGSFSDGRFFGNCTTEECIFEIVRDLATVANACLHKEKNALATVENSRGH